MWTEEDEKQLKELADRKRAYVERFSRILKLGKAIAASVSKHPELVMHNGTEYYSGLSHNGVKLSIELYDEAAEEFNKILRDDKV